MAAKVKLKEIVDALEMQFDEMPPFLDLDTGEIEYELPDEEDECEGDYRRLPTKREVNEWGIMEEFALSRNNRQREQLLNAIDGSGAFRYFKDTIRRLKIEQDWYAFRTDALTEIALEWCQDNGIEVDRDR